MRCPFPMLIKNKFGQLRTIPCGQCSACRLNKAREWSIRIMNEVLYHENNCFLTLTYDDDNLPSSNSLSKTALRLFLKRLRKNLSFPIRYYAAGEYGDVSKRPHYHLIVFGLSSDDDVFKNRHYDKKAKGYQCKMNEWPFGMCFVGDVSYDSACYVAKYTMKKVKGKGAKEHYASLGLEPEFSIMSLKPGIGAEYVRDNRNRLKKREYIIGKNGTKCALPRYYKDKIGRNLLLQEQRIRDFEREEMKKVKISGKSWSRYRDEKLDQALNIVKSFLNLKGDKNEI